jgi:hypothetical protein
MKYSHLSDTEVATEITKITNQILESTLPIAQLCALAETLGQLDEERDFRTSCKL